MANADKPPKHDQELAELARARWRIAIALTALMLAVYFGFILLIAWGKPLMGRAIAPGLSVGILLGAFVIVVACVLTAIYAWWANRHFDERVRRMTAKGGPGP